MKPLSQLLIALVTPFHPDLTVDYPSLDRLLAHTAPYADGYVVMGTTGEPATLSIAEQNAVIAHVRSSCPDIPLLVGVGGNDTAATCRRIEQVADLGADYALAVTPYYTRPPLRGIVAHYQALAKVGLPILIYNVPTRTGVDVIPAWADLAAIYGVVGIKQASPDLVALQGMIPHGKVWCGEDDLIVPYRALGAQGVVSAAANAYPAEIRRLLTAPLDEAGKLQVELYPTMRRLYADVNPIGIKRALALMGLTSPTVRLPLME